MHRWLVLFLLLAGCGDASLPRCVRSHTELRPVFVPWFSLDPFEQIAWGHWETREFEVCDEWRNP